MILGTPLHTKKRQPAMPTDPYALERAANARTPDPAIDCKKEINHLTRSFSYNQWRALEACTQAISAIPLAAFDNVEEFTINIIPDGEARGN